jgi:SAM-dependent methyltransferase
MHDSSYLKMKDFKEKYLNKNDTLKILDVGSLGEYNYRNIFDEQKWDYIGLDIKEGPNVDLVVDDIYNWAEIKDNSYDVIVSGQFFELLEYFWLTMAEIERVLKPNGYVCIIVPSAGPNHALDRNGYKFYEDGVRALAKYVDLEIIQASVDNSADAKPWYDAYLIAKKS